MSNVALMEKGHTLGAGQAIGAANAAGSTKRPGGTWARGLRRRSWSSVPTG
ncbi:hypothetical protein [Acuticoccus mangrovi]|uniref:Uncharacterized protein n=1 Tax=Acuticoccus mangrovi TaxID=2796142 RepID=A0A934IJL3_9HYPH|nr:hypothetical protein [Acuticoccus mangrovi]MBJ3777889.1 hypothetical protein [Acuticoccus mangrovi]